MSKKTKKEFEKLARPKENQSRAQETLENSTRAEEIPIDPANQCPICLNNIQDKAFANGCMHSFCRICIGEWSNRSNQCPVCRTLYNQIIFNVKSDNEYEAIPIESINRHETPFILQPNHSLLRSIMQRHPLNEQFIPLIGSSSENGRSRASFVQMRDSQGNLLSINQTLSFPGTSNMNIQVDSSTSGVPSMMQPRNVAESPLFQTIIPLDATNEEFRQLFRSFQEWFNIMNEAHRQISQANDLNVTQPNNTNTHNSRRFFSRRPDSQDQP